MVPNRVIAGKSLRTGLEACGLMCQSGAMPVLCGAQLEQHPT